MKKYELVKVLRDHGLTWYGIGKAVYGDPIRGALKAYSLYIYAKNKERGEPLPQNYNNEEIIISFQKADGWEPPEPSYEIGGTEPFFDKRKRRAIAKLENALEKDLEEWLYSFHQLLNINVAVRAFTWRMIKTANKRMWKHYNAKRAPLNPTAKNIAYALAVYMIALGTKYPWVFEEAKRKAKQLITRRRWRKVQEWFAYFISLTADKILA